MTDDYYSHSEERSQEIREFLGKLEDSEGLLKTLYTESYMDELTAVVQFEGQPIRVNADYSAIHLPVTDDIDLFVVAGGRFSHHALYDFALETDLVTTDIKPAGGGILSLRADGTSYFIRPSESYGILTAKNLDQLTDGIYEYVQNLKNFYGKKSGNENEYEDIE